LAVGERQRTKERPETGWYFRISGLGCWYGDRFRFGNQTRAPNLNLNLLTRTRLPIAETRDLKMCARANPPVSGFPLLDCVPNR